jgi:hypothetical protein
VALLDAIGAVVIGALVTFFATQHFLKPKAAVAAAVASPSSPADMAAGKQQGGGAAGIADAKTAKTAAASGGAPGFGEFDADTTLALIKTRRSMFPKARGCCCG